MGAWGPRTFEDDLACDWLEDLFESDPIAFFDHCLDLTGVESPGLLECIGVVCTAEMIHGLLRGPRPGLPEAALRWLRRHVSLTATVRSLIPLVIEGLDRVLDPSSEMYWQWEDEGDQWDAWFREVASLRNGFQCNSV